MSSCLAETASRSVMKEPFICRAARESDAEPLLAIYRPFVEETAVSFELQAPTLQEFSARIAKALAGWHWASGSRWRS